MADRAVVTRITTYDTTLRDGEQAEGFSLSVADKVRIARRLDEFGIDIIEGGFPASNPKDSAFFEELKRHPLTHARVAAFGATRRKDASVQQDEGLAALLQSGAPVVTIVGKTWDVQVEQTLQTSLDENRDMIKESVAYLAAAGRTVVFDAEHFFDGYHANPRYAISCIQAAAEAGAHTIALCDTNGGMLPSSIAEIVHAVKTDLPAVALGIHAHDDTGCAVANTIAAVQAGAVQVQGTIGGRGERAGNADLLTVIANLELKMQHTCVGQDNLRQLTSVAAFVADACNESVWRHRPYVGASAFAHKGGLHASAIARFAQAYEHADPAAVGNSAHMVVSNLAGKASLVAKAASLDITLDEDTVRLQALLDDIKQRETQGYAFEAADGSLALLIMRHKGNYRPFFTLESFRVIVDDREDTGAHAADAQSEATIKVHVGDNRYVATGEGTGPVGALDTALRQALEQFYPQVGGMELIDFKVRILDENVGTSAITRVAITMRDAQGSWGTVGVSENIIEASWNALVDSIEYGLVRAGACCPNSSSHLNNA